MSTATLHIEIKKTLIPQLRFPRFDGKWEKKKLGDVLTITSAARVHKDEWTEEGVPFFRSSDVVAAFNGKQNIKAYIPFDLYNSLSKKIGKVKIDDLLITGGGSIGIPFLIKKNEPLYFKDADLLWIKNNENISGYFLYSFFLTPLFKNHLKSVSHIGTIAHYTVIQAKNTPFNTPSFPEQQKIASFLSAVDLKIQQLSRKKELLQQYKKGVMQHLFSGKLRFKDENGEDYPEWQEKKLGEVLKIGSGKDYKHLDEGKIPVFGTGGYMLSVNKFLHSGETVFIGRKGTIDKPFYFNGEFWTVDTLFYTHTFKDVTPKFIYCMFQQINWKLHNEASGVPSLSKSTIEKLTFDFPCIEEQQKIANFLSSIDAKIESSNQQIIKTQSFKKGLLQRMFV